ncbi:cell surface glycoprotein [Kutzneria sp. 744]|nr:cell surface glycoprotein [Kutzneria sp. 744]
MTAVATFSSTLINVDLHLVHAGTGEPITSVSNVIHSDLGIFADFADLHVEIAAAERRWCPETADAPGDHQHDGQPDSAPVSIMYPGCLTGTAAQRAADTTYERRLDRALQGGRVWTFSVPEYGTAIITLGESINGYSTPGRHPVRRTAYRMDFTFNGDTFDGHDFEVPAEYDPRGCDSALALMHAIGRQFGSGRLITYAAEQFPVWLTRS